MFTLENKSIRIDLDERTGSITGLLNKNTGWQAIRQPKLAMGIQMMIPIENYRNNRILSDSQFLKSTDKINDEEAVLCWDKLYGNKSGILDVSVELKIKLQGSGISFIIQIDNKSPYIIEEVWCPCLGGLREPKGEESLQTSSMQMCGGFQSSTLGNGFSQQCGYWGVDYPTAIKTFPAPQMETSFILLNNDKQGIYFGMHDRDLNLVSFIHELKPGYSDSKHGIIPDGDEISGRPAGFVVSAVRMPFIQPGEKVELAPMVINMFEGSWHVGIKPYIEWRKDWFKQRKQPNWLSDIDCWMTLHINDPEGTVRYHYSELADIAGEAKKKGVQALQLIGWARDGQDGAEPYQSEDKRLGTREELKKAINEIEAMGIRVLLMCKFKWADQSIPEYKSEILPHTLKDMYGNPVQFGGYAYQTLAQQLNGASRRSGAGLCHCSKGYRELALREFKKLLDLGSSGMLYDELANDMLLCFDTKHGHRYGESNFKGSLLLGEEFYNAAHAVNPEFLLAGEGPNDHLSQFYSVNYIRSWNGTWEREHCPTWKYMNPEMMMATCLTGWDDRDMVNQCITYGYIINYEPYNFKGRASDIPETIEYGQKARKLRRRLWDYIWKGTFMHTVGAKIRLFDCDNEYMYSVFKNKLNGKKAVVVSNQDPKYDLTAKIEIDCANSNFTLYKVEDETTVQSDGSIVVKPRSLIVLVEN